MNSVDGSFVKTAWHHAQRMSAHMSIDTPADTSVYGGPYRTWLLATIRYTRPTRLQGTIMKTYSCPCTCVHRCPCTCLYTFLYARNIVRAMCKMYPHTCLHACLCTCLYACLHTCLRTCLYTRPHICPCTCLYTRNIIRERCGRCAWAHVCTHVYTHTHIHTSTHTSAHMSTDMSIHISVHMSVPKEHRVSDAKMYPRTCRCTWLCACLHVCLSTRSIMRAMRKMYPHQLSETVHHRFRNKVSTYGCTHIYTHVDTHD